jgi:hypothetical protein
MRRHPGLAGSRRSPSLATASLAAALLAAATALPACGAGTPVARGFGSSQVLPIRDSTFDFTTSGPQSIGYSTTADGGYHTATIDLTGGSDAGQPFGDPDAGPTAGNSVCDQAFGLTNQTLTVTDPTTGQQTVIDGVSQVLECADAGPTLTLLEVDAVGALSLWSGPPDALAQIPLSVTIAQLNNVRDDGGDITAVVLATFPAHPEAVGLFAIDLGSFAVTTLVPPTLGTAAWANGASTTAGALASSTLRLSSDATEEFVSPMGTEYAYERSMVDGSAIMFAGTFPAGPASELALFGVAPTAAVGFGFLSALSGAAIATTEWQLVDLTAQQFSLVVWDGGHQRVIPCPLSAPIGPTALSTRDGTKILFGSPSVFETPTPSPGPLVVVSLPTDTPGSTGGCTTLASNGAIAAGFSGDSGAVFWLIQPETGPSTLWTAAADGSGARVVGTGAITQPRYVSGTELEFELGGDLVWVDTTDTQNNLHPIVEQILGTAIDLRDPWIVIGYDFSTQDGTGTLGLVNRQTGTRRLISPAVALYEELGAVGGLGGIFSNPSPDGGLPTTYQIGYLVRGRNPSPQDGVWVATIGQADLL